MTRKFASSDRLAAQLASLSDYPIMLRAAMCQHRFVGAIEAFHDAAALSLSELFQVESRAAYIYSLAMSALNEGLSTKRVVAYADELAKTGVQKAPYFSLLGEACLLSGELDGAGAHFESAARWSQSRCGAITIDSRPFFQTPLPTSYHRQHMWLSSAHRTWITRSSNIGCMAFYMWGDRCGMPLTHSCPKAGPARDCPLWAVDTGIFSACGFMQATVVPIRMAIQLNH